MNKFSLKLDSQNSISLNPKKKRKSTTSHQDSLSNYNGGRNLTNSTKPAKEKNQILIKNYFLKH